MRLRNVRGAQEKVDAHAMVVTDLEQKKGKWNEVFQNDHPIRLEIGMGKGQFIIALAKKNPSINYIGIERYASVLVRALQKLEQEEELPNLRFICADAKSFADVFEQGEVDKIYLNFSDPWPKERHAKRRLTSKEFLAVYDQFLKADGKIEFKTDNRGLFDFSLEQVNEAGWNLDLYTFDLHHSEFLEGNIMTEYETKFVEEGKPICKMIISRKNS